MKQWLKTYLWHVAPVASEEDYGVDTLKITDDDAAFILGKGGKTKVRNKKPSNGFFFFSKEKNTW